MTDLTLFYGTMESGKTTKLLQDNYNYHKHGHKVLIIKPLIDLKGGNTVVNRTNEFAPVDILLANDESIFDDKYLPLIKGTEVILVDEAQFLLPKQIDELLLITTKLDIPVIAYGLRTDFLTQGFPGSTRLLQVSHSIEEMKTICKCGKKATFVIRKIDGKDVFSGKQVAIDGKENIIYESVCSKCYQERKEKFYSEEVEYQKCKKMKYSI